MGGPSAQQQLSLNLAGFSSDSPENAAPPRDLPAMPLAVRPVSLARPLTHAVQGVLRRAKQVPLFKVAPEFPPTVPKEVAMRSLPKELGAACSGEFFLPGGLDLCPFREVPKPLKAGEPPFGPERAKRSPAPRPYVSPLAMPPRYVTRTRKKQDKSKRKRPEPRMIIPQPLYWGTVPEYKNSNGRSR